jgi:hypothetical protein
MAMCRSGLLLPLNAKQQSDDVARARDGARHREGRLFLGTILGNIPRNGRPKRVVPLNKYRER